MTTIIGVEVGAPSPPQTPTSTPKYCALRAKRSDGQQSQRWELLLYPIPSDTVSLTFRYEVTPPELSPNNPYPLGGKPFADLILQSCLAIVEERKTGNSGPMRARFMERLAAAIEIDKRATEPTGDATTWDIEPGNLSASVKSLVGFHMGFGQNEKAWTENEKQQVQEAMRQGLRRFYVPPPLPNERYGHVWSFLYPVVSLNTVANQSVYDLPEDFGMLDSPITYAPSENVMYPDVQVLGEHQLRIMLQRDHVGPSRPTAAAVRVKTGVQEGGTRYEMLLWPVPDSSYELHYKYRVQPGDDLSVIHGGDAHKQTILEACYAAADSMANKRSRPHEQYFMERLIASVSYDRMLKAPKKMGYNADRSNKVNPKGSRYYGPTGNAVTYNGNLH